MSSPITQPDLEELTPRAIVAELNKFIIGQEEAKRVVAIALRNRTRRRRLPEALQEEINPKNIIMIGPTGVGKTEIARRLARLVRAPFIKVEATKYTEVGYVGRDVESMVRDLVGASLSMVREEKTEQVRSAADQRVRERLLDLLAGEGSGVRRRFVPGFSHAEPDVLNEPEDVSLAFRTRLEWERLLDAREIEDYEVELEIAARPQVDGMVGVIGIDDQMMGGVRDMMERLMPQRRKTTRLPVAEARRALFDDEVSQLLDEEKLTREALHRAEQSGIIFIDEIDKVAGRGGGHGPDVSREGVQRDILPIVEGSSVNTKYGPVRTDHVLFIAAGAFHMSKPSDLIPELQGRFPLRVELKPLTSEDFRRILVETEHSLVKQYVALLATDGVELDFTPDGIAELAEAASRINAQAENIGARRLHTIMERVLEGVAFDAPESVTGMVRIDREYVSARLNDLVQNQDLSRFIL